MPDISPPAIAASRAILAAETVMTALDVHARLVAAALDATTRRVPRDSGIVIDGCSVVLQPPPPPAAATPPGPADPEPTASATKAETGNAKGGKAKGASEAA